jgi:hypothetical protein
LNNRFAIHTKRKSASAAQAPQRHSLPMPQPATFATHKTKQFYAGNAWWHNARANERSLLYDARLSRKNSRICHPSVTAYSRRKQIS